MPRITKVYTRTGDDGTTGLGNGERVAKTSLRIQAYGTVDELNSHVGLALCSDLDPELVAPLRDIQNTLFHVGSDLCMPESAKEHTPVPVVEPRHIDALEKLMDRLSDELPALENFILPGGTPGAAALHVARTVCRRAEREVIALAHEEAVGKPMVHYLNRLSDALFVMARYQNLKRGVQDPIWNSRA